MKDFARLLLMLLALWAIVNVHQLIYGMIKAPCDPKRVNMEYLFPGYRLGCSLGSD